MRSTFFDFGLFRQRFHAYVMRGGGASPGYAGLIWMSAASDTIERMYERSVWSGPVTVADPRPLIGGEVLLPAVGESVPAGFPSPAQDYWSGDLDLGAHLIRDRTATFIVRASGHSMKRAGIFDGDELIVARSVTAQDGHIVIAVLDGELTVKRLRVTPAEVLICAENPSYPDITVPTLSELQVWGVETWVLHRASRV
jgi:DNA polymerase V